MNVLLCCAQIRPPPDEQHLPLTFDFPEGSLIGIAKEKLPVVVSFTGSRPTSFTANVVFLDEEGKRFSLPITGTTDASLLTTKPFMDVRASFLPSAVSPMLLSAVPCSAFYFAPCAAFCCALFCLLACPPKLPSAVPCSCIDMIAPIE